MGNNNTTLNLSRFLAVDSLWVLEEAYGITALNSFTEEEYLTHTAATASAMASARAGRPAAPGNGLLTRRFKRKVMINPRAGMAPPVAFWDEEDDWEEESDVSEQDNRPYKVQNGIALMAIDGPITKKPSSASWYYGGTSGVLFRRAIRQAASDPEVRGALIDFETPGGQAAGMYYLWSDIFSFSKMKPVYGYAEDLCASAGYWAMSACNRLSCGPAAELPCIGTYMMLYDYSKFYKERGIVPTIIKAGEFKGIGEEGLELTAEQKAYLQTLVNGTNDIFLNCVSEGLGMPMETLRPLADGRLYHGTEAVKLGFADAVESYDDAFEAISAAAPPIKSAFSTAGNTGPVNRAEGQTNMRLNPFAKTPEPAAEAAEPVTTAGVISALQEAGASTHAGLLSSLESNGIRTAADLSGLLRNAKEGQDARRAALTALGEQVSRFNAINDIKGTLPDGTADVEGMYGAYSLADIGKLTASFKASADKGLTQPGKTSGGQVTQPDDTTEEVEAAAAENATANVDGKALADKFNARRNGSAAPAGGK